MATCWLSQTGVIFVLLAISKRASDSGDLYIDFNRNHLTFPVARLDFQVEVRFNHSLSNLAYASHIASRIAYHVCIMLFELCTWLIVFLLLVCLVWVEPGDEFANEEPVEFPYEDQVNSDNFAGKMIIPSKSLLSLFARCSLFCYAYAWMPTTCLSCLPNCHVKPLTHHVLANRWLAMLPLCSAPLIALLVVGEVWSRSLLEHLFTCWDIIILLCYLNASIYLVKGGRLGA